MNVVIYARYSSHNQHETSIEGQLKVCYDYCRRNNYTVIGEYIDRAISGTTDNRPDFLKMIADAAKKQFQYVVVYQLDRFSRSRYDSAIYKSKLKKNGVRVLSARENITDDASGILMEAMLEGMAEYYSAELGQKIRRGMDLNGERCLSTGGNIALGYVVDENKKFQIDPETAPIVQLIFEMYAAGNTVVDITNHLNAQGYKTSRGVPFNKSSLNRLLQNKRYIGIYTYKDIEIPNGTPRIISDDLFYKVGNMIDKRKRAPATAKAKEEYLLTTKLFCGHCKNMMTGYSGTSGTGKVHQYYVCKNRRHGCDKKNVAKLAIEDFVIDKCRQLLTDDNINKIAFEVAEACKRDSENPNILRLEKQLKDIERKHNNLMSAIMECDIEVTRKLLYAELPKLESAKNAVEEELRLEKLGQVQLSATDVKFFLTALKNGDVNDIKYRKTLIQIFVNKILLYDDRISIVFNSGDTTVTADMDLIDNLGAHGAGDTVRISNQMHHHKKSRTCQIWQVCDYFFL